MKIFTQDTCRLRQKYEILSNIKNLKGFYTTPYILGDFNGFNSSIKHTFCYHQPDGRIILSKRNSDSLFDLVVARFHYKFNFPPGKYNFFDDIFKSYGVYKSAVYSFISENNKEIHFPPCLDEYIDMLATLLTIEEHAKMVHSSEYVEYVIFNGEMSSHIAYVLYKTGAFYNVLEYTIQNKTLFSKLNIREMFNSIFPEKSYMWNFLTKKNLDFVKYFKILASKSELKKLDYLENAFDFGFLEPTSKSDLEQYKENMETLNKFIKYLKIIYRNTTFL